MLKGAHVAKKKEVFPVKVVSTDMFAICCFCRGGSWGRFDEKAVCSLCNGLLFRCGR